MDPVRHPLLFNHEQKKRGRVKTQPLYTVFRLVECRTNGTIYLFFLFADIVLTLKCPFTLFFIGENLDLTEWCYVSNTFLCCNTYQTPITKQLYDSVTALNIVLRKVCLLTIQSEQFLKMNNVVTTCLLYTSDAADE